MIEPEYCAAPDCSLPVHRLGYCVAHSQQKYRTGKVGPIAEKLSPEAKLVECAIAFCEADPCDDQQYETRRRAMLTASKQLGNKEHGRRVAAAMAAARAKGVRLGRPPKYESEEILRRFEQLRSAVAVAETLGIGVRTVYRALSKRDISADRLQVARSSP